MKKIIVLLSMLMFSTMAMAYINLYPTKFYKNIDGDGAYESFKLYNSTGNPVRYRIYMEDGKDKEISMKDWSEFYPKSITLNPLEEKEIKYYVKAPEGTLPGKYTAKLVIKEVAVPSKEKKETKRFMTMVKINMVGVVGGEND